MDRYVPKVSVGLPVFNGGKYLRKTLDSLLSQTFEDFELIISDNASQDDTERICLEYSDREPRIRYHRLDENYGMIRNSNRVFELATGEYFRWASADDYTDREHLKRCVDILDRHPDVVLCYTKTILIDQQDNIISEYEDNLDLRDNHASKRFKGYYENEGLCNVPYGLIRSDVLRKTRLFGNYLWSDVVLMAELTLHGKFYEIPEYLAFRRMHPDAASSLQSQDHLRLHYDPNSQGNFHAPVWRIIWEQIGVATRTPLPLVEKILVFSTVLSNAKDHRRALLKEAKHSASSVVRSLVGSH